MIEAGGEPLPALERVRVEQGKHLFVLLGQSNMAGRGDLAEAPSDALEHVGLLALGDDWEAATHPLNRYSSVGKDPSIQKVGPGYAFGQVLQRELGVEVGLIVNARGGPGISAWLPGASDGLLEAAIERALLAERCGVLRGVLWHHGEANRQQAAGYPSNVGAMLEALRAELHQPRLHLVAGQLGTWPDKGNEAINAAIARIPDEVEHTSYVPGEGLERDEPGSSHFSAEGQRELGERYAQHILQHVYGVQLQH
jgi:hypothetical protein